METREKTSENGKQQNGLYGSLLLALVLLALGRAQHPSLSG
jgi:hypothetical protein